MRGFIAKCKAAAVRRQFKNRPPRVWALKLQAAWRAGHSNAALDQTLRERLRGMGDRANFYSPRRRRAQVRVAALEIRCVDIVTRCVGIRCAAQVRVAALRRGLAARAAVRAMRRQFLGRPPRTWALTLQRWARGCAVRRALPPGERAMCRRFEAQVAFFSAGRTRAATLVASAARGRTARKGLEAAKRAAALMVGAGFFWRLFSVVFFFLALYSTRCALARFFGGCLFSVRFSFFFIALFNQVRMARGFRARRARAAQLEAEFRGTLSALTSAAGMELTKIALHTSGFGHVTRQALRKFRVKAADGKDHGIPPPRPDPMSPPPLGSPVYSLVWKSKALFGRGSSGVHLTHAVQVLRSTAAPLVRWTLVC